MGHDQTVRPLIYPMALGAAERRYGEDGVNDTMREHLKEFAAASDNIGAFFGEDVFIAVGSIPLITGFVDTTYHLQLDAFQIARWAIPTAICALIVHWVCSLLFDRRLDQIAHRAHEGASSVADATPGVTAR